jgi:15-cis-phytoene synthase
MSGPHGAGHTDQTADRPLVDPPSDDGASANILFLGENPAGAAGGAAAVETVRVQGDTLKPPFLHPVSVNGADSDVRDDAVTSAEGGAALTETALRAQARLMDEDRWLATRFALKPVRLRLEALIAALGDMARASDGVKEPHLAQMRLVWWREALEAMLDSRPAAMPPTLRALASANAEVAFDRVTLLGIADARIAELGPTPFETWGQLDAYVDATAGAMIRLSMQAIDPALQPTVRLAQFCRAAGRAWGYTGLLRASEHWRQQGRSFYPSQLARHLEMEAAELRTSAEGHRPQAMLRALLDRAVGSYREAKRLAVGLPPTLYPAYGYLAFVSLYAPALQAPRTGSEPVSAPLLQRQALLVWRAARGL